MAVGPHPFPQKQEIAGQVRPKCRVPVFERTVLQRAHPVDPDAIHDQIRMIDHAEDFSDAFLIGYIANHEIVEEIDVLDRMTDIQANYRISTFRESFRDTIADAILFSDSGHNSRFLHHSWSPTSCKRSFIRDSVDPSQFFSSKAITPYIA